MTEREAADIENLINSLSDEEKVKAAHALPGNILWKEIEERYSNAQNKIKAMESLLR